MTTSQSANLSSCIGLAGAFFMAGCWIAPGDLGEVTEGVTSSGGEATSSDNSAGSGSTTSAGEATTSGMASMPTSGGMASEPTSSSDSDSGGEPICPEGQPSLSPLWTASLTVTPDQQFLAESLVVRSDGRIAVGAGEFTNGLGGELGGVLWLDQDGTSPEWQMGPDDPPGFAPAAVRRAADDTLVEFGWGTVDGQRLARLTRVPSDGSPMTVIEADLGHAMWPADFELVGDSAVIVGRGPLDEAEPSELWVTQIDLATGALEWEVSPPSFKPVLGLHAAVGPNEEIVVAHGHAGDGAEFKVWRIGDDGSILWTADLIEPPAHSYELYDLVVTPDEQVVAIVQHYFPGKITAHAVGLAEGDIRWQTEIAVEDEKGSPAFGRALVDPDALLLPVGRSPEPWFKGDVADPLTASLVRLSFTGEIVDDTALTLSDLTAGRPNLLPARGKCGDLLLLHVNGGPEAHRLWSFAP